MPYLSIPARSACPGRGSVMGSTSSWASQIAIRSSAHLGKSRLVISRVSGLPIVRPWRRPGLHLDAVGLDLHPPAAAVAELPPRQVGVDVVGDEREAGGQALHHREERGAVGLPGCAVRQGHDGGV